MVKISVALCTYNGQRFLEEQLRSIAEQTRVPDEIVLLDDRSTDHTVELASDCLKRFGLQGRIRVNEQRLGVEQNFSRAMFEATGDVVFFCDQDDVWTPQKVEKMLAPFTQNPQVALVYSDGYIAGPNLEKTGKTLFTKSSKKALECGDSREVGHYLREGRSPGIKASSYAFAAWVRDLAGPIPDNVAHDSWIAYFSYALGQVVALNEPLYFYRRHDNTAGKSSTNQFFSQLQARNQTSVATRLREKEQLARCLLERLEDIEPPRHSRRFHQLKEDARKAQKSLRIRQELLAKTGLTRLWYGIGAFVTGEYVVTDTFFSRLRFLYHDLRFPPEK